MKAIRHSFHSRIVAGFVLAVFCSSLSYAAGEPGPLRYDLEVKLRHKATGKFLAPSEEGNNDRNGSGQKLVVAIDENFQMGSKDPGDYIRWRIERQNGQPEGQALGGLVPYKSLIRFKNRKHSNDMLHSHPIYIKNRGTKRTMKHDMLESADDGYEVTHNSGRDANDNWRVYGPFDNDCYILLHGVHGAALNSLAGGTIWADIDKMGLFEHVTELLQMVRCVYNNIYKDDNFWEVIPVNTVSANEVSEWKASPTRSGGTNFVHPGTVLGNVIAFNSNWQSTLNDEAVITFRARGKSDLHLVFSSEKHAWNTYGMNTASAKPFGVKSNSMNYGDSMDYIITIGADKNQEFVIKRREKGKKLTDAVKLYGERKADLCVTGGMPGDGSQWDSYWIKFDRGTITYGKGTMPGMNMLVTFKDQQPLTGLRYVGFGGGDEDLEFADIKVASLATSAAPVKGTVEEKADLKKEEKKLKKELKQIEQKEKKAKTKKKKKRLEKKARKVKRELKETRKNIKAEKEEPKEGSMSLLE